MAEIVAGVVAAEQAIATGVEAGVALAIAKPTLPLKASLSQIATSAPADTSIALARSNHTVTIVGNKAYIFGGVQSDGKLCSSDVHAISLDPSAGSAAEYACYPSFPLKEAGTGTSYVPCPRKNHAATARGKSVIIHGGCDEDGRPIDESCLWLWDSESLAWSKLDSVTQIGKTLTPRFDHSIHSDPTQDLLLLHGGRKDKSEKQSKEAWLYTFGSQAWTELPSAPAPPTASAFVDHTLYSIASDSSMSGSIYYLDIHAKETDREKPDSLSWQTVQFPINPLTPGPHPREGGALLPVSFGVGRHYLLLLFGSADGKESGEHPFYGDMWTLQLPSHKTTLAGIKDAIREKTPKVESGEMHWAELELIPGEQEALDGKAHPGPRGYFGADVEGKQVFFWGGLSAKGVEADGWSLKLQ